MTHLEAALARLSQKSIGAVQNGLSLDPTDLYLHVDRPIEAKLKAKMARIDAAGGGIVLVVGSAGDGKSHLISVIKQDTDWPDTSFYTDATSSSGPKKYAVDTMFESLTAFSDSNIDSTADKLVLAINLGMLNSLIEHDKVKAEYSRLVGAVSPIFDRDGAPLESERIQVLMFPDEQFFEFDADSDEEYPVGSRFITGLLRKITAPVDENPFYRAYCKDVEEKQSPKDVVRLNFELLSHPAIVRTISLLIIEGIIRYDLRLTVRELLDFVHIILVPRLKKKYSETEDFQRCLLPSLLYAVESDNRIQRAIMNLDPLKHSRREHDKLLSSLFTLNKIPADIFDDGVLDSLPKAMVDRINKFYDNNGRNTVETTQFVFRLQHLLAYHSDNPLYRDYLSVIRNIFNGSDEEMERIYMLVLHAIPRHYGVFQYHDGIMPLNIHGGEYRFYVNFDFEPEPIPSTYDKEHKSEFSLALRLGFSVGGSEAVRLKMDYHLYAYLRQLCEGRLVTAYENDRDMNFSTFLRELADRCDQSKGLVIIDNKGKKMNLKTMFGKPKLSI